MQDFNNYANNQSKNDGQGGGNDLFSLVNSLARSFDGKSQSQLISAVYEEAKKGKEKGTLTNADIDAFSAMLSPMLDDKKRKILHKVVEELKKI